VKEEEETEWKNVVLGDCVVSARTLLTPTDLDRLVLVRDDLRSSEDLLLALLGAAVERYREEQRRIGAHAAVGQCLAFELAPGKGEALERARHALAGLEELLHGRDGGIRGELERVG
jgi:hypothetical protein